MNYLEHTIQAIYDANTPNKVELAYKMCLNNKPAKYFRNVFEGKGSRLTLISKAGAVSILRR